MAVEVQDQITRASHHWTLDKLRCSSAGAAITLLLWLKISILGWMWISGAVASDCCRQRLHLMRDMYDHAADVPKDGGCDEGTRAGDPFSDPPPRSHLIGR